MLKRALLCLPLLLLALAAGCSLPVTPAPFEVVRTERTFSVAHGTSLSSVLDGYLAIPSDSHWPLPEPAGGRRVSDLLRTGPATTETPARNVLVTLTYTVPGADPATVSGTSDDNGYFALPVDPEVAGLDGNTLRLDFSDEWQQARIGTDSLEQSFLRGSGFVAKRPGILSTTKDLTRAVGANRISGVSSMSVLISYRNETALPITFDLWLSTSDGYTLDDLFQPAAPTPAEPVLTGTPVDSDASKDLYRICSVVAGEPGAGDQVEVAWGDILNQEAARQMMDPRLGTPRGVNKQVTAYLTARPVGSNVFVSHLRIFVNVNASLIASRTGPVGDGEQSIPIDLF